MSFEKIQLLRKALHDHNYRYYSKDQPIISDMEFDGLLDQLIALEKKFPEFYDPNSPSQRVGGACLLYTSPSPRDLSTSRMPSSA